MLAELDHEMSEKEWQKRVEMVLRQAGFAVYHTLRSKGSTPGFPDIVAIGLPGTRHEGRLLAVELKVGKNKTTKAQDEWLDHFVSVGAESHVLYPRHVDELMEMMTWAR